MTTSNPWKEVVIDHLVVWGIYTQAHEDDPRKALTDLLAVETMCAVDPLVSNAALSLIQEGYDKALRAFVETSVSDSGETLYKKLDVVGPPQPYCDTREGF